MPASGEVLLDTSVVVPYFRGDAVIGQQVRACTTLYLPQTALGELYDQVTGLQVVEQGQVGDDFAHIPDQLVHVGGLHGHTIHFQTDSTLRNDYAG